MQMHEKLRHVRAVAKKYSVDTPLKSGPNMVRFLRARACVSVGFFSVNQLAV
jgi:hypothetical protein